MATIAELDLTDNTFVLSPMNITDDMETLVTNIIANIRYDKDTFEGASAETQAKINELVNELNNVEAGTTQSLGDLTTLVQNVINLQSADTVNPTFITLFKELYDALNSRQEVLVHKLNVIATTEGRVLVDLSEYNFKSIESYEIVPTVTTPDTRVSTSIVIKKLSETLAEITIRDLGYLQSVNVPKSFYDPTATNKDGTVNGSLDLMLEIIRVSKPLSQLVIDATGVEHQIGTAEVPSVVITSSVVDSTTGILTITGTQGTETGTVLSLVGADSTVVFTIDSTDGTDVFTITSNSAVLQDWTMKIHKEVDGISAFDVETSYESIYPQITVDMLTVADDGTTTFTGNTELGNGILKIDIDDNAQVLADITLDANGIGTTTEQAILLKDGAPHDVRFTVTVNGLESLSKTKTIQIAIATNNNEL